MIYFFFKCILYCYFCFAQHVLNFHYPPLCLTNHSRAYLQQPALPAGREAASLSRKYVPPPNAGRRPQRRRLLSCKVVKSATGRRRPQPPKKEWLVWLQLPCHAIRLKHIVFHSFYTWLYKIYFSLYNPVSREIFDIIFIQLS